MLYPVGMRLQRGEQVMQLVSVEEKKKNTQRQRKKVYRAKLFTQTSENFIKY